jgi:regulatory protein
MAMAKNPAGRTEGGIDETALVRLAISYVGRYATSRAKLRRYLERKLAARGWAGTGEPPLDAIVGRMARLGYVDDRAFASARAAALGRRGYGGRRIEAALKAAGIADEDAAGARAEAAETAWTAALRFAERRRIGPFAAAEGDRKVREKAFAAMVRAGHPVPFARRLAAARPGEIPAADA